MRWALLTPLLWLLPAACATVNTAGMTDHCRRLYDACLNTCPSADSPKPGELQGEWRTDVASCTFDCNQKAKQCQ